MKRVISALMGVAAMLIVASSANAAPAYVQVAGGISSSSDEGAISVGSTSGVLRYEGEYLHLDDRGSSVEAANINLYVQPFTLFGVMPFIGGGVGYGFAHGGGPLRDRDSPLLNGDLGASYNLNSHFSVVGQYRYFLSTATRMGSSNRISDSIMQVGLRYNF